MFSKALIIFLFPLIIVFNIFFLVEIWPERLIIISIFLLTKFFTVLKLLISKPFFLLTHIKLNLLLSFFLSFEPINPVDPINKIVFKLLIC